MTTWITRTLIALSLLGAAAYLGFVQGSARADVAIARYEAKANKQIADLTQKNLEFNQTHSNQFRDKQTIIREKEIIYRDRIAELKPQYDLSKAWIEIHDASARQINPDVVIARDSAPSGYMDDQALKVVTQNYAICKSNADQLESLQAWIRDNQKAVKESK